MSIKRTPVSKLLINQRGDWARDITTKKWIIFITTSNLAQDLNRTFAVASIHQRYYDTITAIKPAARQLGWETLPLRSGSSQPPPLTTCTTRRT